MRIKGALLTILLVMAAPAVAQEPTFRWKTHEAIPSRISDVAVATQIAADVIAAARADRKWHALGVEACRTAFVVGTTELLKRVIHRERPNKLDRFSMPSAHTAHAVAHADYAQPWGVSLALTTAWGREAGGWHHTTDLAVGAFDGWLSTKVCVW